MKQVNVKFENMLTGKDVANIVGVAKTFSSGSVGFYAGGKIYLPTGVNGDVEAYQVSCSIVKVGSKPAPVQS